MITKILKLFVCCAISLAFGQNNNSLNIKIEGMHCAGGCAKMIEHSLNQNDGISAAVDFPNSSAAIIYDAELFSETQILNMVNGYRDGKFTASVLETKSLPAPLVLSHKPCGFVPFLFFIHTKSGLKPNPVSD